MAKEHTWIMVSFLCHFAQHVLMQPTFVLNATILSCSVPYLLTLTNCQKSCYFSSKLSAQKMILWNTIQYYSCIFDFSLGFIIRIFICICPPLINSSPKENVTGTFSEAHPLFFFLISAFCLNREKKRVRPSLTVPIITAHIVKPLSLRHRRWVAHYAEKLVKWVICKWLLQVTVQWSNQQIHFTGQNLYQLSPTCSGSFPGHCITVSINQPMKRSYTDTTLFIIQYLMCTFNIQYTDVKSIE